MTDTDFSWLQVLSSATEAGRHRYETRVAEIRELPRIRYLREKSELLKEPGVQLYRSTRPAVRDSDLAPLGDTVPAEYVQFLKWTNGLASAVDFLEVELYGTEGIREFGELGALLVDRDELFPPAFKKLLFFGRELGRANLAVWESGSMARSPVLLVDLELREVLVLSHSMELFFHRIAFCVEERVPFKIPPRSKKLKSFISDIEPGQTYPPKVKRETVFSFDNVKDFPPDWQGLLSEEDRAFRLD